MLKIKIYIIIILTTSVPFTVSNAKTYITFKALPIIAQNPKKLSGTLPSIQGVGFKKLNHELKLNILEKYDQPDWYIEIESKEIFQNQHYMSFEIHLNISDLTSRYKSLYYTIDLQKKRKISIQEYLKSKKISEFTINQALKKYALSYQSSENYNLDSIDLDNVLLPFITSDSINEFSLKNISSFYLKKNIIGLSFEGNKFTYAFEYNLKTKQIN